MLCLYRSSRNCKCTSASVARSTLASRSSTAIPKTAYSNIHATSASSYTTASGVSSNCAYPFRLLRPVGFSSARFRSARNQPPGTTRPRWTAAPSLRRPPPQTRPCRCYRCRQLATMSGLMWTPDRTTKRTVTNITDHHIYITENDKWWQRHHR